VPPVIAAIAFKVALIVKISFVSAYYLTTAALIAGGAFVARKTTQALTPDFGSRARGQTVHIKQSAMPHRILYGERRISGAVTFIATSQGTKFLHMIITLCAHEVEEIGTVLLYNDPIYSGFLDGDGVVRKGRYRNHVLIQKSLGDEGAATQPFPDLVTEMARDPVTAHRWTNSHKQTGHAKIYIRFRHDSGERNMGAGGFPNISVWVKGKPITDNRTAATHWSPNPAMCMEDFLRTSAINSGLGVPAADIDTTSLDAAANVCDEFVETLQTSHTVDNDHPAWGGVQIANDMLRLSGDPDSRTFLAFQTGDRIQIQIVAGTLPTGLAESTNYYAIVMRHMRVKTRGRDVQDVGGVPQGNDWWPCTMRLASSYINALKGTFITLTGTSTGQFQVFKTAEPRYTCSYLIDVNREPGEILEEMASAMNPIGGGISRIGGKWFFNAAAWVAPTVTLDENHVVGPIDVQTNVSRKERVNTVTGLYVTPIMFDQPTNYPEITNSMYVTEDGEKIPLQVDFAATSRPATAQRMAKIVLEDARQSITVSAAFKLHAMQLVPGDVFTFDNTRFGWSGKSFRVTNWGMSIQQSSLGGESHPVDVIELEFKETASGIYDWNSGEETLIDLSSNTGLEDPFDIDAPTSIQIVESVFVPSGFKAIAQTKVSWDASLHSFVNGYDVEYKLASDSTYVHHTTTPAITTDIFDLTPGLYDFRVRAQTVLGFVSEWTTHRQELFGLRARPGNPADLTVVTTEGLAHLTWTQSVDVDVIFGGSVEIRHDSDTSTGDWANSVRLAIVGGASTQATVPLRDGHLLIKFVDTTGNKSIVAASVAVSQDSAHNWTTLDTATEEPGFTGAKNNLVVTASKLTLALNGGDVEPAGDYTFIANDIDLGSPRKVRVTPLIDVVTSLVNDLVDSRTDNVDDWPNWDGVEGSECNARVEFRHTPDDPTGAPVWTSWRRLNANIVWAWGLQYRLQVRSTDDDANIEISNLSVMVEEKLAL